MRKTILKTAIFFLMFILVVNNANSQNYHSTVNVQLTKVYDATWMDGGLPSINTFKIRGLLEVVDVNNNAIDNLSMDLINGQAQNDFHPCLVRHQPWVRFC